MDFKQLPFQPYLGWASGCPPKAPLYSDVWDDHPTPEMFHNATPKTFIHDHLASMDPCTHPELAHIVGYLSNHHKGPGPGIDMIPAFAISTTTLHGDILAVSPEGYIEDVGVDPPWEEKPESRLFWRGSNTGATFNPGNPWNISHRIRLMSQSVDNDLVYSVLPSSDTDHAVQPPQQKVAKELNTDFLDVSFTSKPIQCAPEICELLGLTYDFKPKMSQEEANQYKYMLDVSHRCTALV
jgi:hypothetical protein